MERDRIPSTITSQAHDIEWHRAEKIFHILLITDVFSSLILQVSFNYIFLSISIFNGPVQGFIASANNLLVPSKRSLGTHTHARGIFPKQCFHHT